MKSAWVREIIFGLENVEKGMSDVVIESILRSQKLKKVAQPLSSPVIKQIYDTFLKDLKAKTIKQIDIVIRAALEYDSSNIDELMEKYRDKYLRFDITAQNLKTKHKNYDEIIEYQLKTFRHRVVETHQMMKIPDANTYGDIIKGTYPEFKHAKKELFKQVRYTQRAINLIIKDISILKVPEVLKTPVINVLKMGYKTTLKYLTDTCELIYNS